MMKYSVSIGRQFGSLGRPIAKKMSEILQIEYYDRDIVEKAAKKMNISIKEASRIEETANGGFGYMRFPLGLGTSESQDRIFEEQRKIIMDIANQGSCIIVGRCADSILYDNENNLNVFIYAPFETRIVNCVNELGMEAKSAKKMITEVDKARNAYHMRYVNYLPNDIDHMDIMINSAILGADGTAEYLAEIIKRKFGLG